MSDPICPFSIPLIRNDAGCRHAHNIIRRGGTEIACGDPGAHRRCSRLHQRLKDVALPEFEVADDLLEIPHGVRVKLQYGGLAGIRRLVPGTTAPADCGDIDALVQEAVERYGGVEDIPCADLLPDIIDWKTARRRERDRR